MPIFFMIWQYLPCRFLLNNYVGMTGARLLIWARGSWSRTEETLAILQLTYVTAEFLIFISNATA